MTNEESVLLAISKGVWPVRRYSSLQFSDIISELDTKGYIFFDNDFSIKLTEEGLQIVNRLKQCRIVFEPQKDKYKMQIENKIYFPKKNILQTTSGRI